MIPFKRNFSESDWANTPKSVQKEYLRLEQCVFELTKGNEQLEKVVHKERTKANKNSSNSDKPPSSDSPYVKRTKSKTREPKGKPGAKAGHKGHGQKLIKPTHTVKVAPPQCDCGSDTIKNERPFYTHQEIELPDIRMHVTHYVLYKGDCAVCHKKVKAVLPAEHRTGYGPRLSALIADIVGVQGSSRTTAQEFCRSVLKFKISLGAIQKVIDRVSEAIEPHYQAIGKVARQSEVNGIDESPWKKNGVLMHVWTMVNKSVAYFKIQQHRSKEAFLDLVEDWKGILISDGYRLYQSWLNLRQTCLAHLIRAAKALTEHPKPDIRQFGENALEKLQTLCAMAKEPPGLKEWNEFYSGFIDLIFDNCTKYYGNEAGKLARRLLREIDSLWVFLEVAGVEPTNNLTERSLRFGVLWRKRSQGTRSNKGNRWVERLLSLRQTARIRNLSSFDILVDAMRCYFKKQNPALSWIYE
jgi:transposase